MFRNERSELKDLREYKRALANYFGAMDLLPIMVPSDQQIGDVYDVDRRWAFVSRGSDCFPHLKAGLAVPSELPNSVQLASSQLSAALGIENIFGFSGRANRNRSITLKFTDVRMCRNSEQELRRALCPDCAHLTPILDGNLLPIEEARATQVLVGAVVYAKKEVAIRTEGGVGATLEVDTEKLRAVGLDVVGAELGIRGNFSSQNGCVIRSATEVPVALGLAFYPETIFDRVQGGGDQEPVAVKWRSSSTSAPPPGWIQNICENMIELDGRDGGE